MNDLAQLREGIEVLASTVWMRGENELAKVAIAAARELLTLREAGALIIVPDEDGKWPAEIFRNLPLAGAQELIVRVWLDALRDAKPDENS